ncbi:vacuolar import and degradation protein-domain-containing protein [Immersiella caudata]|uniref:Vacuolar import and degradation protein-domain-containing protein n=1 Tax=Immersiella caudata TaxID=314043 RepID=A0AA39WRH6_9PEZI|nr:vacuolar import and degradation protein-domain-containing protein [Immersiella caudata]
MSPGAQADSSRDVNMEQEPQAVVLIPGSGGGAEEDGPKQTNLEDDALAFEPMQIDGARDTDGESSGTRTAATTTSVGRISDSGKQRADVMSTTEDSDEVEMWGLMSNALRWVEDSGLAGMGYEYSQRRVIPTSSSSFLRPGSRFTGTQQSERQRYDVQVEIKHVDLRESFLCGYLKIQGLTDDHPTLTTYFEGEIIGSKYGFITQHPLWGATDKIDISHWAKFPAFRPFQKQARKGEHAKIDFSNKDCIFMRWKEHFLVPDHRVRTINGASFEGFYYICFNQVRGEVSGIYFHSRSEKFQQLELRHVEDKGCFAAMEFR